MRPIYINGRFLTQALTGPQRYALEIVRGIDRLIIEEPERYGCVSWSLLMPHGTPSLNTQGISVSTVGALIGHAWDQLCFASASRAGVALSLASTGPVFHRKALVAIHDAAVYQSPESFGRKYRCNHRALGHLLARNSGIITVSEFSQSEISAALTLEKDAILIAPNGHEHLAIPPDDSVVGRLGLKETPYFVAIGSQTRNKNLGLAVKALELLENRGAKLVIIGDGNVEGFAQTAPPEFGRVLRAGRLADREIAGLLRSARALVFPSRYEGSGLPPLEAMINQCPVLASTAQGVRETCGNAAAYFDPKDTGGLAELMAIALNDNDGGWRKRMVASGLERAKRFKWLDSARLIADRCLQLAGDLTQQSRADLEGIDHAIINPEMRGRTGQTTA